MPLVPPDSLQRENLTKVSDLLKVVIVVDNAKCTTLDSLDSRQLAWHPIELLDIYLYAPVISNGF